MNASPSTLLPTAPQARTPAAHRLRRTLAGSLLALGLASLPLQAQPVRSNEPVTLNFVGAEIEAVARTMATITGRNVVVDPRVQGQITLATDRPVTPAAAVNQFAAALRLQGFSLVDTGGLYKVVPEADAKLMGSVVVGTGGPGAAPNTVVTQIFRLNHESANNLVPVLRPLIGPNNTINVNPGNNSLVITDYADNLQRIGRIISALDVAGATDVEVIPLQHAIATDLLPLLNKLSEDTKTNRGKARALVVTAGNSNVFTGKAGRETCAQTAAELSAFGHCQGLVAVVHLGHHQRVEDHLLGMGGLVGDDAGAPDFRAGPRRRRYGNDRENALGVGARPPVADILEIPHRPGLPGHEGDDLARVEPRAAAKGDHPVMPARAQHCNARFHIGRHRVRLDLGKQPDLDPGVAQQRQHALRHRQVGQPRIGHQQRPHNARGL